MQYLANTELKLGFGDRIFFFHLVLLLLSEGVSPGVQCCSVPQVTL